MVGARWGASRRAGRAGHLQQTCHREVLPEDEGSLSENMWAMQEEEMDLEGVGRKARDQGQSLNKPEADRKGQGIGRDKRVWHVKLKIKA